MSSYRRCRSTPSLSINYPYYLASSKLKPLTPDLPPTWVISQPLTFPSLKQPPAGALIDPADGLGANLPRGRQEVTVFHCSIWCNYPQNKHILDRSWPFNETRCVGRDVCALVRARLGFATYQSSCIINKTYPEQGVGDKWRIAGSGLLVMKLLFL